MQTQEKAPVDTEALGRKLDALIEIELYNNRLLLSRYRNGDELYQTFKSKITDKISLK